MADTRPPAGDWSPSYDFAEPNRNPLRPEVDPSGKPWESAPASSHVWGWRLYDLLDPAEGPFIRKFLGGRAELQVRFRDVKTGRITSEYSYYFTDGLLARKFLADFRDAAHPGHVVQELIRRQIRYTKTVG